MTKRILLTVTLPLFIHSASAHVFGEDDRGSLDEYQVKMSKLSPKKQKKWVLTPDEVRQAMACTGNIICRDEKSGTRSSATVVCPPGARKDGKCKADRIATAAHGFVDEEAGAMRSSLDQCFFQNHNGFKSLIKAGDLKSIDLSVEDQNPETLGADRAAIRLKKNVPGCNPYDVTPKEERIFVDTMMLMITGYHSDMDPKYDNLDEPVVFRCMSNMQIQSYTTLSSILFSECDSDHGASGGGAFIRSPVDQRWTLSAIVHGFRKNKLAGQSYQRTHEYEEAHIMLDQGFLDLLRNPGVAPVNEPEPNDARTSRP